jgi:5-methylcytosine-specific restriction enzyme subunit McrC
MPVLFEYHNTAFVDNPQTLKSYLHTIWQEQYAPLIQDLGVEYFPENEFPTKNNFQPFLSFDGHNVRARNYIGFIQIDNLHLEIYPKVFKNQQAKPALMLRHLFFWFDYCRKWKFPFTKSDLDRIDDVELPELIIYLMASKMLETVSLSPISLYQPVQESLFSPKGRISFSRYLTSGFINGNQHIIECDHEPFVFDNRLNRVIKYTSRLLLNKTKFAENQNILQELIFILDEVEDQACSYYDLETVVLNPLFLEYAEIKDICKIVLQQLLYSNQQYDLSQWSLLFPMEYIFEDFIAGFIENKFSLTWKVEYQKSNMNLSTVPESFRMQHDIFLTSRKDESKKIIIDTKYKLRDGNFKQDKKKGIYQPDLYQMVSYALRRGCNEVLILYPNIDEGLSQSDSFIIESGFPGSDKISIIAAEVPFWSTTNFGSLSENLFTTIQDILKKYE